jgi:hypothetical protein
MKKFLLAFALSVCAVSVSAQTYWNTGLKITSLRLPLPPVDYKVEYLDLNNDGTPDATGQTHYIFYYPTPVFILFI